MLVSPNASFANLNKSTTILQEGKGTWDVVIVAEAVQDYIHSLSTVLLQEGLHVCFKLVSIAAAGNVLHTQITQKRMLLLKQRKYVLSNQQSYLRSNKSPQWISVTYKDPLNCQSAKVTARSEKT